MNYRKCEFCRKEKATKKCQATDKVIYLCNSCLGLNLRKGLFITVYEDIYNSENYLPCCICGSASSKIITVGGTSKSICQKHLGVLQNE